MRTEEHNYDSASGKCKIHVVTWYPDSEKFQEPVGIVQIAHGMIDHIERYENLAEYLVNKGYIVTGNDHLGHGESVADEKDLGYITEKHASACVVKDMYRLTTIMKSKYPKLPYYLIGHSMGSFMTRRYITVHGHVLDGVAILGTGDHPMPLLYAGRCLAGLNALVFGQRHTSSMINKMMFGNFNKRIPEAATTHDWLTRDPEVVNAYLNDPKCSFEFSVNGCIMVLDTLIYLSKVRNMRKIPKQLPIFLAAGEEDPVGNYSKCITKLAHRYEKYHLNCKCMIYKGCRHELHNELIKEEFFDDIYEWMQTCI